MMIKKLNYFSTIKYLSKYIGKHRQNFIMFYFGWLCDSFLFIVIPVLFGIMIDEIVYYQNVDTFISIAIVFVILIIFSCGLYFFIYFKQSYLMNMYTFQIRKDMIEHIQRCDAQVMSNISTGNTIDMLVNCPVECMHFVTRNMIHITNHTIMMVVYATYLMIIDWRVGLFAMSAAPISTFINAKFGKKIRQYGDEQRKVYSSYIGWVFEILTALRDIRMLGAKNKTNDLFQQNHKKMFSLNIKSGLASLTAENIVSFSNLVIQLSIFTLTGHAIVSGSITVGVLTIIISFYNSLVWSTKSVSSSYLDAQNRISFIQRIYDFMQLPEEDNSIEKKEIQITDAAVQFNHITFSYNDKEPVIRDLSLKIDPGSHFALIGKSGSGKTTLAYMLIGFYQPQLGQIEIDGQKLSDCTLKSIRQNIGLVQQDVLVFDGTIRENILLGNLKATIEELMSACRASGIWDYIESLPNKLDTIIGSNGVGISGGQKQRIAIARIYLKNPKIVIFDEAASALDTETEELIHEAWNKVLSGRTAIIIAHRQSSVMLCDQVAMLENGNIVEIGEPIEMMQVSERFRKLFAI